MELVPLDKDFPAKSQGVQMLKLMEFITFSTSLTSPLLGVAVTVNYSHLSNGVKSLHLSRSHFETLIQAVGSMSYSPDAMVLQIQADFFIIKSLGFKNFSPRVRMTTPLQGPKIWRQPLDPTTTPRTTLLFQWRLLPLEPSPLCRRFPHCMKALCL